MNFQLTVLTDNSELPNPTLNYKTEEHRTSAGMQILSKGVTFHLEDGSKLHIPSTQVVALVSKDIPDESAPVPPRKAISKSANPKGTAKKPAKRVRAASKG